jgi:competence protein ComFC
MIINPQLLNGPWTQGFALDLHTASSSPIKKLKTVRMIVGGVEKDVQVPGDIIGWDTKRPEIAEELYRLKYCKEEWRVSNIAHPAVNFLKKYLSSWQLSFIIPIPPSDMSRTFQPVYRIAEAIGNLCKLRVNYNTLKKVNSTSQLKEIEDSEERKAILEGAFDADQNSLTGCNILLVDDLYRSGETLKAAAGILKNKAGVKNIYVLTITKTRSKR